MGPQRGSIHHVGLRFLIGLLLLADYRLRTEYTDWLNMACADHMMLLHSHCFQ